MNVPEACTVLVLLLAGPLLSHKVERNLEIYILGLGVMAISFGGQWSAELLGRAAYDPVPITVAVIAAGVVFEWIREPLHRSFVPLRRAMPRAMLTAATVFLLAVLSSVITAIVAAIILVEAVGFLEIAGQSRVNVTVAACFAIGLGAVLTPVGEPLATIVTSALGLEFFGLFRLLAAWVLPGAAIMSLLAGFFARGDYDLAIPELRVREDMWEVLFEGVKVYAFIAGLVFISEAFAPMAERLLPHLGDSALFWANTSSAALDNATLVALEVHKMSEQRVRMLLLSLLVSGGILIPGNIPNIISAGALRITSIAWAKRGIPIGLIALGIYFALLRLLS